MHELSVTQSIFDICLQEARKHSLRKITEINIRLGRFSTFEPESIIFYFNIMSKGSIAENAKLKFEIIKIKVLCLNCDNIMESDEPIFVCTSCGHSNFEILEGREFSIESIVGDEEVQ
ncbi:MAG: hydrogenase maturation nickel metallochaperone HypA [candidate division WOR-3 bacterium]